MKRRFFFGKTRKNRLAFRVPHFEQRRAASTVVILVFGSGGWTHFLQFRDQEPQQTGEIATTKNESCLDQTGPKKWGYHRGHVRRVGIDRTICFRWKIDWALTLALEGTPRGQMPWFRGEIEGPFTLVFRGEEYVWHTTTGSKAGKYLRTT